MLKSFKYEFLPVHFVKGSMYFEMSKYVIMGWVLRNRLLPTYISNMKLHCKEICKQHFMCKSYKMTI